MCFPLKRYFPSRPTSSLSSPDPTYSSSSSTSASPTAGTPSKLDILPKMIARQTGEEGTSLHLLRYSWTHIYRPTRDAVHVHERCKVNVSGVVREEGVIFAEYFGHLLDRAPRVRLDAGHILRMSGAAADIDLSIRQLEEGDVDEGSAMSLGDLVNLQMGRTKVLVH